MHNRNGSILLFSLMILALVAVVSERLIRSRLIGSSFAQMMMKKELAGLLAMSGINIARGLVEIDKEQKKDEDLTLSKKNEDKESWQQRYFKRIVPMLNRWKEFKLTEEEDNIDGNIKLCIVCENGKININQAFDFKKSIFKKEYEFLLKGLEIKGKLQAGELFKKITDYLKKRKRMLDDISELSHIDGLQNLGLFYEPPPIPQGEKVKSQSNHDVKLADIFTTWTSGEAMHPLLLSDGLCSLLMIRRPHHDDPETMQESFDTVIGSWKDDVKDEWKLLEYLYDEQPKLLKEINRLFSKQFGTPVYSVVSCGKIGEVEQRVIAILQKDVEHKNERTQENKGAPSQGESQTNTTKQENASKKKRSAIERFKIVKIYWL